MIITLTGIGEGVGGRFGSAAQGVLGGVEEGTTLVLSTVGVGSSGVTDLLSGGLVLACDVVLARRSGVVSGRGWSLLGWNAPATLSPAPVTFSEKTCPVDF